ncbi:polysaccharide deacetylase family sporulation protein PdaB [Paenibacillus sp. J31TS4]|uniref:polysaccharide deacetylase family protein n=1 Tax=Paenibacillus sp. J31TS4 TaxID=2807195 RepID=UPI001B190086|nr:polysaccharide deacetylase family protein [Paenibacillus sp. J31TS4]GIP39276.1 polysaccharide deacetylase family sporulation protein PdaB [Paenibacillus sp. J31TS4]
MHRQLIAAAAAILLLTALPLFSAGSGPGAAAAAPAAGPASQQAGAERDRGRDYYEARGEIVWEVPTEEKVIALTFDDGPDPTETPIILDLLKEYNAHATFFVVGNRVDKFPELVKRELAEGHELANHTYHHSYFRKQASVSRFRDEVRRTQESIQSVTGQRPHLFRPPGGYYSETLVQAAREAGYLTVLWSWHQDTKDWQSPGVDKIVGKVLSNARNGDIVLFHDHVERHPQTAAALKEILPELQKRGFRFVTVSELLQYRKSRQVHS